MFTLCIKINQIRVGFFSALFYLCLGFTILVSFRFSWDALERYFIVSEPFLVVIYGKERNDFWSNRLILHYNMIHASVLMYWIFIYKWLCLLGDIIKVVVRRKAVWQLKLLGSYLDKSYLFFLLSQFLSSNEMSVKKGYSFWHSTKN